MAEYYAILTDIGSQKLAAAIASGDELQITEMAVGDGAGTVPQPTSADLSLVNENARFSLNALKEEPNNGNHVVLAEAVIPESSGGWWIRELGLYDVAGDLVAVANCPPSYKPQAIEGAARVQYARMYIAVSSSEHITLLVDPSVVLATRAYVDDQAALAKQQATQVAETYTANLLQIGAHSIVLVNGCAALQQI